MVVDLLRVTKKRKVFHGSVLVCYTWVSPSMVLGFSSVSSSVGRERYCRQSSMKSSTSSPHLFYRTLIFVNGQIFLNGHIVFSGLKVYQQIHSYQRTYVSFLNGRKNVQQLLCLSTDKRVFNISGFKSLNGFAEGIGRYGRIGSTACPDWIPQQICTRTLVCIYDFFSGHDFPKIMLLLTYRFFLSNVSFLGYWLVGKGTVLSIAMIGFNRSRLLGRKKKERLYNWVYTSVYINVLYHTK